MFAIYFLKKSETIHPGRWVGRIDEVSQRAVKPDFPTDPTIPAALWNRKDDSRRWRIWGKSEERPRALLYAAPPPPSTGIPLLPQADRATRVPRAEADKVPGAMAKRGRDPL